MPAALQSRNRTRRRRSHRVGKRQQAERAAARCDADQRLAGRLHRRVFRAAQRRRHCRPDSRANPAGDFCGSRDLSLHAFARDRREPRQRRRDDPLRARRGEDRLSRADAPTPAPAMPRCAAIPRATRRRMPRCRSPPAALRSACPSCRRSTSAAALLVRARTRCGSGCPICAPRPVPTMIAVGVARPSAHGQAMTSTATALTSARAASPATHQVSANVNAAITTTTGTKMPLTRSARRWMGAFDPCASATRRTMPASSVELPTPVASHVSMPSWLSVPANTLAPAVFAKARLSPVSMLSSTLELPSRTTPSTGMLSPARTTSRSPVTTCDSGTSMVAPSRSTMRNLGLQPQEALEGRRRAGLGARFKQLAQQDQRDHRRAGLEIDVLVQCEHGDHRAERPCHGRAENHQHVHVRAAAAQRVPRADIETAANPELHRRCERQLPAARNDVGVRRMEQAARRQHRHHLRQQRQRQDRRDDEVPPQRRVVALFARLVAGALRFGIAPDTGAIACSRDRLDQLRGRRRCRVEADGRDLGGEIDRRMHAGDAIEHLFDARRTGRAGHARQAEFDTILGRRRPFRGKWPYRDDGLRIHGFHIYPPGV